jgi:hypothetical protein
LKKHKTQSLKFQDLKYVFHFILGTKFANLIDS